MIIILNMVDNLMYEARYLERDGYSDLGGVLMFGWKFRQPPDSQIAKEPNL